jgi:diguanylate cyclase (GGDEF)-like protein
MDTQQFDIDDLEREKFIRLAELSSEDHSLVRELQCQVIAPNAASIVDAFYAHLRREPEFETILMTNRARLENLKMTYQRYLLSFGVDFESADYFRERMRIGAIHASVGVPLSLYVAAGRLLQQLIISHIRARTRDDRRGRALVDLVIKLTTLDTSLAIETYHGTCVGELKSSLQALRARGEKLVQVLSTDTLTGVASRRGVLETLQSTLDRSRRHAQRTGVILLDLDHFKQINDRHGHGAGDKVLQVAAARIRSALRSMDTVGRYGGDEFLIILPAVEPTTSLRIAERVRLTLGGGLVHTKGVTMRVTVSQGIAVSDGSEYPQVVIERADAALYAAKRAGRDRVVSADDSLASPSAPALRGSRR